MEDLGWKHPSHWYLNQSPILNPNEDTQSSSGNVVIERRVVTHTCTVHIFKNISREPIGYTIGYTIGYNTNINTDGVEWGRSNISIVLRL